VEFLFWVGGLWEHRRVVRRERLGKGMKTSPFRRRVLVAAVLATVLVWPSPAPGKNKKIDAWNARMQETVQLLRAGDATQARAIITPVLEEMTEEINPGKQAGHAFALALTLRALTEAGSGDERSATWDWHVAQQLDPAIESWDLREFGAAGEMLSRHRLSGDPVPPALTAKELELAGGQKPKILTRGRGLNYLEKARERRWEGSILLKVRIDERGIPTYPRIVWSSHEVGIVLATCEYSRELVYSPAMKDGQPVAVLSEQKASYRQD
jgi:hypothetical protein